MDLGLKGRRALVTGGTAGIGFAIAKCLADEGTSVVVVSRDEAKVSEAISRLRNSTGKVMDLLDEGSIRRGVELILGEGPIDILVNNVGGPAAGNLSDLKLSDWDKGYHSLLRSVVLLGELVLPGMRSRKWGRVLTVTSTSAKELISKLPISATFRAGLTAWSKAMAKECGRSGILVNNLLPGPTRTERLQDLEKKSPEFYRSMETESALGRVADPEEIGRVAAFLCSSANTYLTGTDVLVDGGFTKSL